MILLPYEQPQDEQPRDGQPQISASLRGWRSVWVGSNYALSLGNNEKTAFTGASIAPSGEGLALSLSAGTSYLQLAADADTLLPTNEQFTFAVVRRSRDTTSRTSTLFGYQGGTRLQAHAPYSNGILYFDYENPTAGSGRISVAYTKSTQRETLVFVRNGNYQAVYRNGALLVSAVQSSVTRSSTTEGFRLGATTGNAADNEDIELSVVASVGWSDAECKAWCADPFGETFEPQYTSVPVSAGSTSAITLAPDGSLLYKPSPAGGDNKLYLTTAGDITAKTAPGAGDRRISLSGGNWLAS